MSKPKHEIAGKLIKQGEIKTLSELFHLVDRTPFSRDIGTTPERLSRILINLELANLKDIHNTADLLAISPEQAFSLFEAEFRSKKRRK